MFKLPLLMQDIYFFQDWTMTEYRYVIVAAVVLFYMIVLFKFVKELSKK